MHLYFSLCGFVGAGGKNGFGTIVLKMELAVRIQIEELPEGIYLATSDELPALVAQGRTIAEALDIARDVARKLIEARREREGEISLSSASNRHDYTIVVAA
ncbi:MAG TPA: type II toxin-antitoxin system HicB family antitoxin [Bryobacteraceae bacterium]